MLLCKVFELYTFWYKYASGQHFLVETRWQYNSLLLVWEVQVDVNSTFGHLGSSSAGPCYKTKLSRSESDRGATGVDPAPPGQHGAPPGQVTEAKGGHGWAPSTSLKPGTSLFTAENDAVGSFAARGIAIGCERHYWQSCSRRGWRCRSALTSARLVEDQNRSQDLFGLMAQKTLLVWLLFRRLKDVSPQESRLTNCWRLPKLILNHD